MFDPTLPVQTLDDREAAVAWIVPNDVATALPLQGWMRTASGAKVHHGWTKDGKSIGTVNADDLVNTPVKHKRWVNVYRTTRTGFWCGDLHERKEDADRMARDSKQRIACIPIEFEEGEGLN